MNSAAIRLACCALTAASVLAGCRRAHEPPRHVECVYIATGERFTYSTANVESGAVGVVTDDNGWRRAFTRQTQTQVRCREIKDPQHDQ